MHHNISVDIVTALKKSAMPDKNLPKSEPGNSPKEGNKVSSHGEGRADTLLAKIRKAIGEERAALQYILGFAAAGALLTGTAMKISKPSDDSAIVEPEGSLDSPDIHEPNSDKKDAENTGTDEQKDVDDKDKKEESKKSDEPKKELDCSEEKISCETGKLEGKKLKSLFTWYTGIYGEAAEAYNINFYKQLGACWSQKKRFIEERGMDLSPVVEEAEEILLSEYKTMPHETMTLEEYRTTIQGVVDKVKKEIDWDKVAELKGMDEEEIRLAKKVVELIDGKSIMAYGLTELMPGNGEINKEVLEFLLKYAGARYVYSIPAMGDEKTSFGPYQFTSYALHDLPNDRRGASVINQALPKGSRISGSVIRLRGDAHHRAAFLFMINNICDLVKRSEDMDAWKKLDKDKERMRKEITIFCAVAHHQPSPAKTQAANWLENGGDDSIIDYLNDHLKKYGKKTETNFESLGE